MNAATQGAGGRSRQVLLVIALAGALAGTQTGCGLLSARPAAATEWQARQDALRQVEEWSIKGRIAIRTEREAGAGALYWSQRRDEYRVRVAAPLGGGTYELAGDGSGGILRAPHQVVRGEDAAALLQRQTGLRLPMADLAHWIKGIPAPARPIDQLELDENNRLRDLAQAGWTVRYKRYLDVGGLNLPGRLDLSNEHVRVRLSVREWTLPR